MVLVGAGHSHLEVLRRLAREAPRGLDVTLITLEARHYYSGMIPGYLTGRYAEAELMTDVVALARRAGAACLVRAAVSHDPVARVIGLADGGTVPYDLISFNVGSLPAGGDTPESGEAERIKPLARVPRLKARLEALAGRGGTDPARLVVIGGGSGGVEIAMALAARLDRGRGQREITIVERGPGLLAGSGVRFRRRAHSVLDAQGIAVRLGCAVTDVGTGRVRLAAGETIACDLALWLTGPVGSPLLAGSGLPVDGRGFLLIDEALRSVTDPRVFAAGDCGTLERYPTIEKSGVAAVRQAPVLWHNLVAAAQGRSPVRYRPRRRSLAILNTSDGRALLRYGALVSWSRWAWRLKQSLDQRFMDRYRPWAR